MTEEKSTEKMDKLAIAFTVGLFFFGWLFFKGVLAANEANETSESISTVHRADSSSFEMIHYGSTFDEIIDRCNEPSEIITDSSDVLDYVKEDVEAFTQIQIGDEQKMNKLLNFFNGTEEETQESLEKLVADIENIKLLKYQTNSGEIRFYLINEVAVFRNI